VDDTVVFFMYIYMIIILFSNIICYYCFELSKNNKNYIIKEINLWDVINVVVVEIVMKYNHLI
jgi:hypothetical protein